MIFNELQDVKIEIENERVSFYNNASDNYNEAVNYFNDFIDYRNHQFKPEKPDELIQVIIDTANIKLTNAKTNLKQVIYPDTKTETMVNQLAKAIVDLDNHIKEQQTWLTDYFSKSKSKRKQMFYERKITLFGKPIN